MMQVLALTALSYSAARPSAMRAAAPRADVHAQIPMSGFDSAVGSFADDFPEFFKRGFGPTTKAERWNGRHAMFGWAAIIATGYAQSHGLIPDADTPLDLSVWGPLAATGTGAITKGRAIILIAHVHALMVSVASALAPFPFSDKLTLNMKASEADEQAYGLFPPLEAGLTPAAEILNGRLAMLGLISVVISSVASGTPFLETVDAGLGGMLLK